MKSIQGKKVLITGGAGFIGSTLASQFVEHNEVVIFDNFDRDQLSNTGLVGHPNLRVVRGDILDAGAVLKAAEGVNLFIHAAAIAGIVNTVSNPVNTMRVNILGTANALEAAAAAGPSLERFLEFSTSEIFGSRAYLVDEANAAVTGAVGEARWTYAVGKLAGEHLTHAYHRQHGLPTVTIRPFNVYGPGQVGEGAISIMVRRALNGEDLFIFGDGTQIRAWCYVDDMIRALHLALGHPAAVGESFNIGNARAVTTIYGLAQTICRVTNSTSQIIFKDALSADIELRIPSVDKARKLLDFEASVGLDEGLKNTAEWIAANDAALPPLPEIFTKN